MNNETLNGALSWNIKKFVSKGDYLYAVVPEHPKRTKNNYVLAHRVIVENFLGRLLNDDEVVHHINENKKDNRVENLQVLSFSDHARLHKSEIGKTMLMMKCPACNNVFHREKRATHIGKKRGKYTCCSAQCRGRFSRKIQLYGVTSQVESAISENILKEYNSLDNSEETHLQEIP